MPSSKRSSKRFSLSYPASFFILSVLLAGLLVACGDNSATSAPVTTTAPAQTSAAPAATAAPDITTIGTTSAATGTTTSAITAASSQSTPGQTKLTTAPATITKANGEKINMTLELARTSQEQETGLMGRLNIPDETGMLFIFPNSGRVAFWMKDTPLALSIAFITQDGKIIDIQDMESYSLDTHQPNRDYIYALEVAKGYFARRGVKPGDTFTFQG